MTDSGRNAGQVNPSAESMLWAYGYELVPPQNEQGMTAIRNLLDREHAEAKRTSRLWTGRLVTEVQATHVLIVSAGPELDLEINRKLEAELQALGAEFVVTVPMPFNAEPADT
jgi:hypothetical protein